MVSPLLRALRRRRNPVALLVIATAGIARGVDYTTGHAVGEGTRRAAVVIDVFWPLSIYAIIWFVASTALAVSVFIGGRLLAWAAAVSTALWTLWAAAFTISHFGGNPSGLITGAAFFAVSISLVSLAQLEDETDRIQGAVDGDK